MFSDDVIVIAPAFISGSDYPSKLLFPFEEREPLCNGTAYMTVVSGMGTTKRPPQRRM